MSEVLRAANHMISVCLSELIKIGLVSLEQVNNRWYLKCNQDSRLEQFGFAAAVSIDENKMPVLFFNSKLTLQGLVYTLPHEAIHLAQICSGMSEPCSGYTVWKGKKYPTLAADDPNYFSLEYQPWEAQAKELEPVVREALLIQFPFLR